MVEAARAHGITGQGMKWRIDAGLDGYGYLDGERRAGVIRPHDCVACGEPVPVRPKDTAETYGRRTCCSPGCRRARQGMGGDRSDRGALIAPVEVLDRRPLDPDDGRLW